MSDQQDSEDEGPALSQAPAEKRLRFIVGEVSITYAAAANVEGLRERVESDMGTISKRFEHVVDVNAERGYRLLEWRMTSTPVGQSVGPVAATTLITETIVAVFEDMREVGS